MKLDKKTSLKIAALSLAGLITVTCCTECKKNKNNNYVSKYVTTASSDLNITIKKYNNFLSKIDVLSRVSSKLDKYKLEYEKVSEDQSKDLLTEQEIDSIINDYISGNNLEQNLSILKFQYELYNEKIYYLYEVLHDYAIAISKLYISNCYNLDNISKISINNVYYNRANNEYYVQIKYNDIPIGIGNDDNSQKIMELISIANNMNFQKDKDKNSIQLYSESRNNLIKNSYDRVNEIYYGLLNKNKTL